MKVTLNDIHVKLSPGRREKDALVDLELREWPLALPRVGTESNAAHLLRSLPKQLSQSARYSGLLS